MKPMLTADEVCALLQVSKTTLYCLAKKNLLPRPLKIGGSARWIEAEVTDAVQAMMVERDAPKSQPTRRGRPRKVIKVPQ